MNLLSRRWPTATRILDCTIMAVLAAVGWLGTAPADSQPSPQKLPPGPGPAAPAVGTFLTIDGTDPAAVVQDQTFVVKFTVINNSGGLANGTVSGTFDGSPLRPMGGTTLHNLPSGQSASGALQAAGASTGMHVVRLLYRDKPYIGVHPLPQGGLEKVTLYGVELRASLNLTVTAWGVYTQHNDSFRTGAQVNEVRLTPAMVRQRGMQAKYTTEVDGDINAQPLYVPNALPNGVNGLFVATMNNNVYALDADMGTIIWQKQLRDVDPARPKVRGIASTPVIDAASNRIYVLFSTKNQDLDQANCVITPTPSDPNPSANAPYGNCWGYEDQLSSLDVAYWLIALDYRNGNEVARVRVSAEVHRSDGSVLNFVAKNEGDRTALLLDHGSVYVAFRMRWNENVIEYHGWVIRYRAADLSPQGAFCTSPNVFVPPPYTQQHHTGAGIWQGGGGLAADLDGSVYFLVGNGLADVAHGSYGDSFVKLTPNGNGMLAQAFTPSDPQSAKKHCPTDKTQDCSNDALSLETSDADLGAGGAMVLPGTHLVIGGGKTGYMYLLNSQDMTLRQQFKASTNLYSPDQRWQDWDAGPHLHGSPTYWRGPDPTCGYLYVWGEKDVLRQYCFKMAMSQVDPLPLHTGTVKALSDAMPGGMLSISAKENTAGTGILWATLPAADLHCKPYSYSALPGHLYAFDAETLEPLWDDAIGSLGKWLPPTIAGGNVFIGSSTMQTGETTAGGTVYELGPGVSVRLPSTKDLRRTATVTAWGLGPIPSTPRPPSPPFQPTPCGTAKPQALHEGYLAEASIPLVQQAALRQVAPEESAKLILELRGAGQLVYMSVGDANKARWQRESSVVELWKVSPVRPLDRQSVLVWVSDGQTWVAADGSTISTTVEKTGLAPDRSRRPLTLFRVSKHVRGGLLNDVEYVQELVTDGGEPPSQPPSRPGLVERVPYSADYVFYSAR